MPTYTAGLPRTQTVDATTFDYDPAGRLTSTILPTTNGYTETRSYDRAGRLASVASVHPTNGALAH
ncbi:hypothetical protein ABZ807_08720 [Micromonospora sp. NPDC047548]|uniref:hypothetical protein n=1 Tax=Micromonospora sp. NPDC047548 TaxID=3155624 RepID=UPI0033CD558F